MSDSITPFQLLRQIADSSRSAASQLPAQREIRALWSGIGFTVAGRQYVAPMNEISEILSVPGYTRLPGVKPWVNGVANVRGRLVPIIDFVSFLGERSSATLKTKRILVIDYEEMINGIVVDSVEGMQHFPVDTFSAEMAPEIPESLQPFSDGHYVLNNKVWSVFSLQRMMVSEEFMAVAV
ncbi:chemotaxis protein CheW [Gynuella sunshinyii]|uniref:Chemotaxis signal transduction protein n=1 Tax=Gynuella sunshinyii YC6258 TaxID=1445510 RepID=A0A0C5V1P6_9GAMM|nr:chemotaxis protein CheW [Gynuella sunshinyii]AJQ93475.1 chemotaxis signal transduction protein [Gynuella sunshinyii YC6258]